MDLATFRNPRYMGNNLNQIIPNLWLGGLTSIFDIDFLKQNNIQSIVTVLRGEFPVPVTFFRHKIELDDIGKEDILSHLTPAVSFIQKQLDSGRGVLVHCQAGISRSPTVVAAYLIYTRGLDVDAAIGLIRENRRIVDPNPGFLSQLGVFHKASSIVSDVDKTTRILYLERAVRELKSGKDIVDVSVLAATFLTPQAASRRKIRCKMCRYELGTRENMVGHGLNAPTQIVGAEIVPPVDELPPPSLGALPESPAETSGPSQLLTVESPPPRWHHENKKRSESPPAPPAVESTPTRSLQPPAQLHSNPQLASLRLRSIPLPPSYAQRIPAAAKVTVKATVPLVNLTCSGYFIEPMKWMSLLEGQAVGKIICPNKKCNAKLGNYDWAGVCCSCKEWVVPGFCIHRSKVDEIG